MNIIHSRRALIGSVLALSAAAAPVAAQASDPLKAKPGCVDLKTNRTVKPCPVYDVTVKPAHLHANRTFTVRFRLRKAGTWTLAQSNLGSGGPLEGDFTGVGKKGQLVVAKVKDSSKGEQRLAIILASKDGNGARYDRYLGNVK